MRFERTRSLRPFSVLFVCEGGAAPALFAEAIMNRLGAGAFHARSAIDPGVTRVEPLALEVLRRYNYRTVGLQHRSRTHFAGPKAPSLDYVFDLNGNRPASGITEIWPGHPLVSPWAVPDPAAAGPAEDDVRRAYVSLYGILYARISVFVSLPLRILSRQAVVDWIREIGRDDPNTALEPGLYAETVP